MRIDGIDKVQRTFDRLRNRLKDVTQPMQQAREEVRNEIYENFVTQAGGTWAARKKDYAWPPLRKNGRMFMAAIDHARNAAIQKRGDVTTLEFRSFHDVTPYAKYHLDGTSKMPARPFAPPWRPLSAIRQQRILDLLRVYIEQW